jgi:hypothetical protein
MLNAVLARPFLALQKLHGRMRLPHVELVKGAPKSAFPPEWHDLWFLYKAVRARKPKLVLEFGSGCSTPIIAAALRENGVGRIVSVESDPKWLATTQEYFPRELNFYCDLVYCPAVMTSHLGTEVWRHERLPQVTPDLIYLDGPPLQGRVGSIDVLELEPSLSPGCGLIVDGRKANFAYLRKHLKRQWAFQWHRIAYRGIALLTR